jgi:hypothetical protein
MGVTDIRLQLFQQFNRSSSTQDIDMREVTKSKHVVGVHAFQYLEPDFRSIDLLDRLGFQAKRGPSCFSEFRALTVHFDHGADGQRVGPTSKKLASPNTHGIGSQGLGHLKNALDIVDVLFSAKGVSAGRMAVPESTGERLNAGDPEAVILNSPT